VDRNLKIYLESLVRLRRILGNIEQFPGRNLTGIDGMFWCEFWHIDEAGRRSLSLSFGHNF